MELGYTGELEGSAEKNIWLHKAVMRELAANGGKVPAELLDYISDRLARSGETKPRRAGTENKRSFE